MGVIEYWNVNPQPRKPVPHSSGNFAAWINGPYLEPGSMTKLVRASALEGAVGALALIAGYFEAGWPDDDDVREIGRVAREARDAAKWGQ